LTRLQGWQHGYAVVPHDNPIRLIYTTLYQDCIGVANEIHLHIKLYPRCISQYYDRKYHPSKCHSNIYI